MNRSIKKYRLIVLCLLLAALFVLPASATAALPHGVSIPTHFLDSILPDRGAAGENESSTTGPEEEPFPFMNGEGGTPDHANGNRAAAPPPPPGENLTVGMAVFLVALAGVAVAAAFWYAFHRETRRHNMPRD